MIIFGKFGDGQSKENRAVQVRAINVVGPALLTRGSMPLVVEWRALPAISDTNPRPLRPFLTGSAPQTEFDVTHRKQTTEKFLTGARMHIKDLATLQVQP